MEQNELVSDGSSSTAPLNQDPNDDGERNNDIQKHDDTADADHEPEEPKCDEEGLRLEYDVVVCGTGLVQSILASALARAGKSVLHCDGADYYGELDAVWTLPMVEDFLGEKKSENERIDPSISSGSDGEDDCDCDAKNLIRLAPEGGQTSLRWHYNYCSSTSGKRSSGIRIGTHAKTPLGDGIVRAIRRSSNNNDGDDQNSPTISLEIELNKWKLADGQSPNVYVNVNIPEEYEKTSKDSEELVDPILLEDILSRTKNIRSIQSVGAEAILTNPPRMLALDATPAFILASGRAVEGMLQSGVADYLEFKTLDGLYWLEKSSKKDTSKRNKNKSCRDKKDNDRNNIVLSRVPCNKNDIFATKLLAPMEKRRFMKFIQLCMDYATKVTVAEELQQDEADKDEEVQSLNERHLNQGRSLARPQNKAVDACELQILQEAIENGSISFDDFLAKNHKLSPKLRSIVRYALAWETSASSTSLANGMVALRKHLQALGRYGTTAFLVPLYGSGELPQAFCRSAAVFGATYLLRRELLAIQVENENDHILSNQRCEMTDKEKKHVKGVILSKEYSFDRVIQKNSQDPYHKRMTKAIKCSHVVVPFNAVDASMLQEDDDAKKHSKKRIIRRIAVLKGSIIESDNGEQRHVIFIPPSTIGNDHAIHGVVLDSSALVSPKGYTVLHLTTTAVVGAVQTEESGAIHVDDAAAILERAQAAILDSKKASKVSEEPLIEVYHVSFSHASPDMEKTRSNCHPIGVHLCSHSAQVLTTDVAFEQAEKIFSLICPGAQFLGLSNSIDKVIRERAEEKYYDDDEKNVLESAVGMIEDASSNVIGT
mmetsp:Transcript_21161/g.58845  ORF Transcript_21161/g.58845 Transcript_21161/m.58845 type:complete len:828 (-) Transcript_21161:305-2788(-)